MTYGDFDAVCKSTEVALACYLDTVKFRDSYSQWNQPL